MNHSRTAYAEREDYEMLKAMEQMNKPPLWERVLKVVWIGALWGAIIMGMGAFVSFAADMIGML